MKLLSCVHLKHVLRPAAGAGGATTTTSSTTCSTARRASRIPERLAPGALGRKAWTYLGHEDKRHCIKLAQISCLEFCLRNRYRPLPPSFQLPGCKWIRDRLLVRFPRNIALIGFNDTLR